jgi:hypothetical protein
MNFEDNVKEILKMAKNGVDINTLSNSSPWRSALMQDDHLMFFLRGTEVTVRGDLRNIIIGRMGEVYLTVTIDNKSIIGDEEVVTVKVPKKLTKSVLGEHLLPDTGVILKAQITPKNIILDFVSIQDKNLDLFFPYYRCAGDNPDPDAGADGCKHLFGYTVSEDAKRGCSLCGSRTYPVYNLYKEGLAVNPWE